MERVIVRREPLVEKVCPMCGKTFMGLARQMYCSRLCQNRADYQRHAEQRRQHKREVRERAKA